jgi:hypothetical protein
MEKIPVDFGVLMLNHPSWYEDIKKKVPTIPAGWETCCVQVSWAFNKSGARIKNTGGNVGLVDRNGNYIILVSTMRDYLNNEYFEAENYQGGERIAKISQIVDRTGIIAFGDRHIDLWNKTHIHRPSDYLPSALWEDKTTLEKGIFFWEI